MQEAKRVEDVEKEEEEEEEKEVVTIPLTKKKESKLQIRQKGVED